MRLPTYSSRLRKSKAIIDPDTGKRRFETPDKLKIPVKDTDMYIEIHKYRRLDRLAYDVYGSSGLWWIICAANNMKHPTDFGDKSVLRVPRFKEDVLQLLK
jgi:hypothetical protein